MAMKKIYIGMTILALMVLAFVVLALTVSLKNRGGKAPSPTPFPVSTNFDKDYSKLNLLRPGKSTLKDVERINGFPYSASSLGSRSTLYYQTPSIDFKNIVVLENNVVLYALEYIFGNYRGRYENYVSSYGEPAVVLYDPRSEFNWFVFLKNGVAVQASNNQITAVVYFIPGNESGFMDTVAKDLKLLKVRPSSAEAQTPLIKETTPAP